MTGITFIGHSTLLIETKGKRILTDPLLRRRVGYLFRSGSQIKREWYNSIDCVLISHLHKDHFDIPSLRMLDNSVRIIVPKNAGDYLKRQGFRNVQEVTMGDDAKLGTVNIKATHANHSDSHKKRIKKSEFLGYIIEGNHRVYFAGDTDIFNDMRTFGRLDAALLPVWGWGPRLGPCHIDPKRAVEALRLLKPKIAIPIHWGTYSPFGIGYLGLGYMKNPPNDFASHAKEKAPKVDVRILKLGEKTAIK